MWRISSTLSLVSCKKQWARRAITPSITLHPRGVGEWAVSCILFSALLFLASCATKRVEIPTYEGVDLRDELNKRNDVKSIKSTFSISIDFERDRGVIKGDAVLLITPDVFDLQVYSSGFLVADIRSIDNVTKSNPPINKNRLLMLVEGLRNSFFWWSLKGYDIRDNNDKYLVSNSWRMLIIDKKTIMPEKQIIELEEGRQLKVFYEEPNLFDDIWFPSGMKIELSSQSVKLKIETLSVNQDNAVNH